MLSSGQVQPLKRNHVCVQSPHMTTLSVSRMNLQLIIFRLLLLGVGFSQISAVVTANIAQPNTIEATITARKPLSDGPQVTRAINNASATQKRGYSIPLNAFEHLSAKPVTLTDEYDEELYGDQVARAAGTSPVGSVSGYESTWRDKYDAIDVINKTPSGLLRLRGFDSKLYYVHTSDGYYVHVVRIVNPNVPLEKGYHKRPVIFNHGLFESATMWLMNSRGVKPTGYTQTCGQMPQLAGLNAMSPDIAKWRYLNAPMMLSNSGYDVWLMSMRGTEFSLKHDTKQANKTSFWNYSLDDFALGDIPAVVDYVIRKTGSPKVGYVGHSQATLTMFALLSTRPEYANIVEPVIAVAPVTYFKSITSVGRSLFNLIRLTTFDNEHGPYPPTAKKMRHFQSQVCDTKMLSSFACQFIELLIAGQGRRWLRGYYNHMPHYTSLKVLRQFDQLISSGRYAMYDYGPVGNMRHYNSTRNPDYKISRIKSRSIVLISARLDALSAPSDIEQFKRELRVPVYKSIMIEGRFNHFDLITHPESRRLVNEPILKVMESFEQASPNSITCGASRRRSAFLELKQARKAQQGRKMQQVEPMQQDQPTLQPNNLQANNTNSTKLHQPATHYDQSRADILIGANFDHAQLAAAVASLAVARPASTSYDADDGLGSPDKPDPVPTLPPSAISPDLPVDAAAAISIGGPQGLIASSRSSEPEAVVTVEKNEIPITDNPIGLLGVPGIQPIASVLDKVT